MGDYISGEARGLHLDIVDAIIKVMAEASQYTSDDALNSFYVHFGEIPRANI